jgi:hypothetical protein
MYYDQHIDDGGELAGKWTKYYFYFTGGSNIFACILLIIVTSIYITELKKFTYTYNEKKTVIYIMLAGTILQLLLRGAQALLNVFVLIKWEKQCILEEKIGFHIYTCCYFFLSDMVPAIGYFLFLRKEIQAQISLEEDKTDSSSFHSTNSNIASLIEKLYKNKELKKSKTAATYHPEFENET